MANMFLTKMSLIGGARTGTGDSGLGYASWSGALEKREASALQVSGKDSRSS
jgi:hypothetical protein